MAGLMISDYSLPLNIPIKTNNLTSRSHAMSIKKQDRDPYVLNLQDILEFYFINKE